ELTAVDIDSELIEQLLNMNLLPKANEKLSYVYDDAVHYINHTQDRFDLILIDVFDGAQSPDWLCENDFLQTLHRCLKPNGALGFNLLIDSEHEFNRFYRNLRLICQQQTLCMPVDGFENTIAYGFRQQPPQREMSWYIQHTLEMSQRHHIDYMEILSAIYTTNPSGEVIG
ncbi:MAG: hypothetical protein AAF353_07930, partial [Pseudomonadota bacterium]